MVEFSGYLTGKAEKGFVRKTRNMGLSILAVAIPLSIPMVFFVAKYVMREMSFLLYMLIAFCFIPLICFIPRGKKEHVQMLPKRIYTDADHIVCVADRYTESKLISDVSKVIDHGEYYELCFPFGKLSDKFICQKDLLTKGTLTEFEALFAGKIEKKTD